MHFTIAAAFVALCSGALAAQENDWEIKLYPGSNCDDDEHVFMSGIDNWSRCTTWKDPAMGVGPDVVCEYHPGKGEGPVKCGSAAFPTGNSYQVIRGTVDIHDKYNLPLKMCDIYANVRTYEGDGGAVCITDFPAEGLWGHPL